MSGSNRDKGLTSLEALFCILALFGVVWIGYAAGRTFGIDIGRNEVTAREHYEREKKDALSACARTQGGASVECATKAIEAAQERSETRQDLYAQQDMSRWAFWMLVASVATFAVTTLGVWFVKRTLDATLKAVEETGEATVAMRAGNKIARRQFEAGFRPSLSVDIRSEWQKGHADFGLFKKGETHRSLIFRWHIIISNIGQHTVTITDGFIKKDEPGRIEHYQFYHVLKSGEKLYFTDRGISTEHEWNLMPNPGFGMILFESANRDVVLQKGTAPIIGKFVYADPLSKRRELGFGFIREWLWTEKWKRWGNRVFNYERELPEEA